jgi:hypothetical protein
VEDNFYGIHNLSALLPQKAQPYFKIKRRATPTLATNKLILNMERYTLSPGLLAKHFSITGLLV